MDKSRANKREISTQVGAVTPKTEIDQSKAKALKSAAEYRKRVSEIKHVIVKINSKHFLEVPEKNTQQTKIITTTLKIRNHVFNIQNRQLA